MNPPAMGAQNLPQGACLAAPQHALMQSTTPQQAALQAAAQGRLPQQAGWLAQSPAPILQGSAAVGAGRTTHQQAGLQSPAPLLSQGAAQRAAALEAVAQGTAGALPESLLEAMLPSLFQGKTPWLRRLEIAFIVLLTIGFGAVGYTLLERYNAVDALSNATLVAAGLGPIAPVKTSGGKLFLAFYGLLSVLIFLTLITYFVDRQLQKHFAEQAQKAEAQLSGLQQARQQDKADLFRHIEEVCGRAAKRPAVY